MADIGYNITNDTSVELVRQSDCDLKVVNSARVSFNRVSLEFDGDRDARLIKFLATHNHWTPFAQVVFKLRNFLLPYDVLCNHFIMAGVNISDGYVIEPTGIVGDINISMKALSDMLNKYFVKGSDDIVEYVREVAPVSAEYLFDDYIAVSGKAEISPAHDSVTLRHEMPIFTARQWFKHEVGFVRNELSRRYVRKAFDFYLFDEVRKQSKDNKQCSTDETLPAKHKTDFIEVVDDTMRRYASIVGAGGAGEQARALLPQNMMVSFYETALHKNYYDRIFKQRLGGHAQKEIRKHTEKVYRLLNPIMPPEWNSKK